MAQHHQHRRFNCRWPLLAPAIGGAFAVAILSSRAGAQATTRPVEVPVPAPVPAPPVTPAPAPPPDVPAALPPTLEPQLQPAGPPAPPAPVDPHTAAELKAEFTKALQDLAQPEASVRDAARQRLMDVQRRDLPIFEKVIRENLPLAPSQATVLREIVTQIYLSGDDYDASRNGFVGVRLGEVNIESNVPEDPAPAPPVPAPPPRPQQVQRPNLFDGNRGDERSTTAVVIVERMPGFCGARVLQNGDVVLGLSAGRQSFVVRSPTDIKANVEQLGGGQTIQLDILRQGEIIRVPLRLDSKPAAADPMNGFNEMQNLLDRRREEATTYWEKTFAPLVAEKAN